mmetsp:Transcript_24204/g.18426  ORF Transcript_24204/g.18426 Transcript_24204/m.18426 type:complete len:83 (-) Transcript_24204:153-401(-)
MCVLMWQILVVFRVQQVQKFKRLRLIMYRTIRNASSLLVQLNCLVKFSLLLFYFNIHFLVFLLFFVFLLLSYTLAFVFLNDD